MNQKPKNQSRAGERRFPPRVLIADVGDPDGEKVELELLPDTDDWGDLPTASFVLQSKADE